MMNKKIFIEIPLYFLLCSSLFSKEAEKKTEKNNIKIEQKISMGKFFGARRIRIKDGTEIGEVEKLLKEKNIYYSKAETNLETGEVSLLAIEGIPAIFCFVEKKYRVRDYDYAIRDIINYEEGSFIKPSIAMIDKSIYCTADEWRGFIIKDKGGVSYRSLSQIIEFEGKKIKNPSFVVKEKEGCVELIVDGWNHIYRFEGNKIIDFINK